MEKRSLLIAFAALIATAAAGIVRASEHPAAVAGGVGGVLISPDCADEPNGARDQERERDALSGCSETTYSFYYGNAHFVIVNVYCEVSGDTVTAGDVTDHLCDWPSTI